MLDFTLSPLQLDLPNKAREFAINEVFPAAWYFDEKDALPLSVLKKAINAGIMNTDIPAKYGGMGLGIKPSAPVYRDPTSTRKTPGRGGPSMYHFY